MRQKQDERLQFRNTEVVNRSGASQRRIQYARSPVSALVGLRGGWNVPPVRGQDQRGAVINTAELDDLTRVSSKPAKHLAL
jgi:hypothetical protein